MRRASFRAALLAFVLAALIPHANGSSSQAAAPMATAQERERLLTQFRTELVRWREGETALEASLRSHAARLADIGRGDAADVLAGYARLSVDERLDGVRAEERFTRSWNAVRDFEATHVDANRAAWRARSDEIELELRALADEARADRAPSARALSLLARLGVQRVIHDESLAGDAKARIAERALDDAQRALATFVQCGQHTPQLEPLWIAAELERASGSVTRADELYRRTLDLARAVHNEAFELRALEGRVRLAWQLGDCVGLREELDAYAGSRTPEQSAWLVREHARYLLHCEDEADEARDFLLAHRPAHDAPAEDLRGWRAMLAATLLRTGDIAGADALTASLDGSAAIEASIAPERDPIGTELPTAESSGGRRIARAQSLLLAGDARAALAWLEEGPWFDTLDAAARQHALRDRGSALFALGRHAEAITTLEAALREGDRLDARLAPTAERANVAGEVVGLETVVALAHARGATGDALGAALDCERAQSRELRAHVYQVANAPFENVRSPGALSSSTSSSSVADELQRADLLAWSAKFELGCVTWAFGADRGVVVHVARDGRAVAGVVRATRSAVQHAVRRLREAATANDDDACTRLARDVQALVFTDEVLASLRAEASRFDIAARPRVLLLAHGPLEELPLELLPFLEGDDAPVPLVLPGLTRARPHAPFVMSESTAWRLCGAPLAGVRPALPGARAELESAASMYGGAQLVVEASFTREALVAALASSDPLHLATHLASRDGEPGIVLDSDLWIGAREVREACAPKPLAVLSLCESAGAATFRDAHALRSIAREFLVAGTRNVIVTSWPVEDRAAQSFGTAFHRALRAGDTPSRAAARARDELRRAGVGPADRAAFRCLGED